MAEPTPTAAADPTVSWESAVAWVRSRPEYRQLVLDAYYDDPLVDAAQRYWRSEEWRCVRPLLPAERGPALDVGAGRGIASYALAMEGFSVTALEPDPSALVGAQAIRDLATATGLPIDVRQDFSERLPFEDRSFNLVFARSVLHHTSDLASACREFFRVLRPGGRLIATREHVISRQQDLPAFFDVHPLHKLYGGENAFMRHHYESAIRAAGLRLCEVIKPLQSAINFAPHTSASLRAEIAARAGGPVPGLAPLLRAALAAGPVWAALRPLLDRIDRRPGRLYSFVAERP